MDVHQTFRVAPSVGSAMLKRLDSDGSGDLGRAEIAGRPKFEAAFDLIDTDDSGALSAAEIDARVNTHRRREARPDAMNQAVFAAVLGKLGEAMAAPQAAGADPLAARAATSGGTSAADTASLIEDLLAVTPAPKPPAPPAPTLSPDELFQRLTEVDPKPAPVPPVLMDADHALAMLLARA
ncbi:hypothetical protein GVY41_09880 [Frigidibacter albus]|uniref:EF-hand domain-containing protein n=1 Tax=Frigidibacter albus TaxID=1465486 RepID=A0A6L8VG98_9RHOB|nr:hypothetical protein [Frigidibacter albus]MZQ89398.1 hypothetical protein [Frigidibacter albus]NBE31304.1 hypothetical protein [Frigidibacter albus]GGH53964.1 hypothetical protein GCM10011341_19960 [Frigidibacter albus]